MGLTLIFVAPLILSSKGRELAHDASVHAPELAKTVAEKGEVLAQDSKVAASELASEGKQTAVNLSARAKDTTSDMSGTATDIIKNLPQMSTGPINDVNRAVISKVGDIKEHVSGSSMGDSSFNSGAVNNSSHSPNSAGERTKSRAFEVDAGNQHDPNHLQSAERSLPAQIGGE
jgi:polyhydroxyalkanoate synthesis regulator phasin